MNKIKVTEKQIIESYQNIIKLGYCELQEVLETVDPLFYTCGTYGWKADIYQIEYNVVISTGYCPIGNIVPSDELIKELKEDYCKIYNNKNIIFEDKKMEIIKLIKLFCQKAIKESEK